ncbi:MAG: bifunctional diaminohydroxyphosphoribosylaminopyrimidine deaminase/5-amino-6-(5-phosphoribosylamino)uracil reductase RibD [Candidatus Aminicenantes bacterium]|nr:bifunctional diaminohydroxyphosphoribosylaminopyrimidine deaminase/5-amino-6-(5-phosphoribosylamino)uracil reductase RibD [Candidatus Aminicenantes bacterium]
MTDLKDFAYLEMAYGLAEKARGWASPNPYVGAVVVRRNKVVGHGFHERPGRAHAEAIALERAGRLAGGSTLYVTLEPCVHWGRTPPCVDAVIRAKPKRVVVSALDPNPIVFQKGIRRLRAAGIDVSVGLLRERNATLNETYTKYITRGIPFVTLKAALSLDGRTATRTMSSRWISHPLTRDYVHLLRGEQDAILVGIQTLIKDDPLLTVRHPQWGGKKIVRVILDSQLRFPLRARILSTLSAGSVIVFSARGAPSRKRALLERRGVEVIEVPGPGRRVQIAAALADLGKRGIASLLVEGGSRVLTAMIEGRFADKLLLTISPRLIGGLAAPSFLEGEGVRLVQDSYPVRRVSSFLIGPDIVIEGYL